MNADVAWRNGDRLVEDILGDPDDIWEVITSVRESDWAAKWSEYKLHRFPAGHKRLWQIGRRICDATKATLGAFGKVSRQRKSPKGSWLWAQANKSRAWLLAHSGILDKSAVPET